MRTGPDLDGLYVKLDRDRCFENDGANFSQLGERFKLRRVIV